MMTPGSFTRRSILGGLLVGLAAPAVVRASSLMPIKQALCYDHDDLDLFEVIELKPMTPTRLLKGVEVRYVIPSVRRRIPLALARKLHLIRPEDLTFDELFPDPDVRELWEMNRRDVELGDTFKRIILKPDADSATATVVQEPGPGGSCAKG